MSGARRSTVRRTNDAECYTSIISLTIVCKLDKFPTHFVDSQNGLRRVTNVCASPAQTASFHCGDSTKLATRSLQETRRTKSDNPTNSTRERATRIRQQTKRHEFVTLPRWTNSSQTHTARIRRNTTLNEFIAGTRRIRRRNTTNSYGNTNSSHSNATRIRRP